MSPLDDLNRLDPLPGPAPYVPPQPAPAPRPAASTGWPGWAVLATLFLAVGLSLPAGYYAASHHSGPAPVPAPIVKPKAPAYTGPLFGLLVLPNPPTKEQSDLRASMAVRQAATAEQVSWRTALVSEPEVAGYAGMIADAGGPPVVLWLDDTGKLLKATRAPIEATVVADMKGVRGR